MLFRLLLYICVLMCQMENYSHNGSYNLEICWSKNWSSKLVKKKKLWNWWIFFDLEYLVGTFLTDRLEMKQHRERERERERVCVCMFKRERVYVCVFVVYFGQRMHMHAFAWSKQWKTFKNWLKEYLFHCTYNRFI